MWGQGFKNVFIICPVRNASADQIIGLTAYVGALEKEGYNVHYPPRDTNQIDPTGGWEICKTNSQKIYEANEIHVWYDPASLGSVFDLAVLFTHFQFGLHIKRRIVIINESEITDDAPKSFFKVLRQLRDKIESYYLGDI